MSQARRGHALQPRRPVRLFGAALTLAALTTLTPLQPLHAAETKSAPGAEAAALQALPALDLSGYTGTWYQVAWFPNRFQKQCVSDTTATYTRRSDGAVDVLNRCRLADGSFDSALGLARPAGARLSGSLLQPAQLQVSFLPAWLRWLPIWGDYWVIQRPDDGRYAVIAEATRQYLWVLARQPRLSADDLQQIRDRLVEQGFDLAAWQLHPHTAAEAQGPSRPSQTPSSPPSTTASAAAPEAGQSRRPASPPAAQTR